MPRRPIADDDLLGLSPDEVQELWLGPGPHRGSLFRDREALRAAWEENRAELMRQFGSHGRRPLAFYEFDWRHGPRPPYETERSELWRRGLLTEPECVALEREWYAEFVRCSARDFAIARPWPQGLLTGAAARRAHYRWADIPAELIKRWTGREPTRRKERARGKEETRA
jgi:hypothetical protein